MIDLFVNGLQLDFKKINKYTNKQNSKVFSYIVILLIGISLLILVHQYQSLDLDGFMDVVDEQPVLVNNGKLVIAEERLENINQIGRNTGITIEEDGLLVRHLGIISYDLLRDVLNQPNEFDLIQALRNKEKALNNYFFFSLYLKSLIFIIWGFILVFVMVSVLRHSSWHRYITKSEALAMNSSLLTLPALAYLVLKVLDLRNSFALFLFTTFYVLIVFFFSRYKEDEA